jgi:hypothetical protein
MEHASAAAPVMSDELGLGRRLPSSVSHLSSTYTSLDFPSLGEQGVRLLQTFKVNSGARTKIMTRFFNSNQLQDP